MATEMSVGKSETRNATPTLAGTNFPVKPLETILLLQDEALATFLSSYPFPPLGLNVNNVVVLLDHLLFVPPVQRVDDFNNIWFSVRAVHSFIVASTYMHSVRPFVEALTFQTIPLPAISNVREAHDGKATREIQII